MKIKKLLLLIPLFGLAACGTSSTPESSSGGDGGDSSPSSEQTTSSSEDASSSSSEDTTSQEQTSSSESDPGGGGGTEPGGGGEPEDQGPDREAIVNKFNSVTSFTASVNEVYKMYINPESASKPHLNVDDVIVSTFKVGSAGVSLDQDGSRVTSITLTELEQLYSPEDYAAYIANPSSYPDFDSGLVSIKDGKLVQETGGQAEYCVGLDTVHNQKYYHSNAYGFAHDEYIKDGVVDPLEKIIDPYLITIREVVKIGEYDKTNKKFTVTPSPQVTQTLSQALLNTEGSILIGLTSVSVTLDSSNNVKNIGYTYNPSVIHDLTSFGYDDGEFLTLSKSVTVSDINNTTVVPYPASDVCCPGDVHIFTDYEYKPDTHREVCLRCGLYLGEAHNHDFDSTYNVCKVCGHFENETKNYKFIRPLDVQYHDHDVYLFAAREADNNTNFDVQTIVFSDEDGIPHTVTSSTNAVISSAVTLCYYSAYQIMIIDTLISDGYVDDDSCLKITRRTYEAYTDVDYSDFSSILTLEDLEDFKEHASSEPVNLSITQPYFTHDEVDIYGAFEKAYTDESHCHYYPYILCSRCGKSIYSHPLFSEHDAASDTLDVITYAEFVEHIPSMYASAIYENHENDYVFVKFNCGKCDELFYSALDKNTVVYHYDTSKMAYPNYVFSNNQYVGIFSDFFTGIEHDGSPCSICGLEAFDFTGFKVLFGTSGGEETTWNYEASSASMTVLTSEQISNPNILGEAVYTVQLAANEQFKLNNGTTSWYGDNYATGRYKDNADADNNICPGYAGKFDIHFIQYKNGDLKIQVKLHEEENINYLYFTDADSNWADTVYVHSWGGASATSWPGTPMYYVGDNNLGQGVYKLALPADNLRFIINDDADGDGSGCNKLGADDGIEIATAFATNKKVGYYYGNDSQVHTYTSNFLDDID